MSDLVAINGQIFSSADGQIPATDRAFLFGDGVLETLCAVQGRLIDLAAHLARLRRNAETIRLAIPWSDNQFQFEMENLLSLTRHERSALRLIVSRGLSAGMWPSGEDKPQRYLFCSAYHPDSLSLETGVKLRSKRDSMGRSGEQIKSPAYLPAIQAYLEAKEEGFDDILWINRDGELCEAGYANIFLMAREGDLLEIATPPVQSGLLPGITRARIIELLHRSRIPVRERAINLEELARFDEGFLSSSVRGLVPIQSIDKHRLYSTRPAATFRQILRLYKSWEFQEGGASPLDSLPS